MADLEYIASLQKTASGNVPAETEGPDDKPIWIYVDNSNIWCGAKQLAAKEAWMIPDEDPRLRIDIQKLTDVIARGRSVAGGVLFGSANLPPVSVSYAPIWELKIQTAAAACAEISRRACVTPPENLSTIVVVSGDSHFFPGVKKALEVGWKIEIYSWSHALATCLKYLPHEADNVLVNYLDSYLSRITFINRQFKISSDFPNTKAVLHMNLDAFPSHSPSTEFYEELEKVSRWPFQYYWDNTEADDLVLVFPDTDSGQSCDVDVFLKQVTKRLPVGVESAECYDENRSDNDSNHSNTTEQCQYKFCCKYGVKCWKEHTNTEMEFFRNNRGAGKNFRKVISCQYHERGMCNKFRKDCDYAHGKEDALCPHCGQNGHFQEDCPQLFLCHRKMCCQYGVTCHKQHTDVEMEFFQSNGGVGKPFKKVESCQFYEEGLCNKSKKDCGYAHGEEDALCRNCGQNGHFESTCSYVRKPSQKIRRPASANELETKKHDQTEHTTRSGKSQVMEQEEYDIHKSELEENPESFQLNCKFVHA